MKNLFYSLIVVLFLTVSAAYTAENLDNWISYEDSGILTFVPSGTSATLSGSSGEDSEAWGTWYQGFSGSNGGVATFRIDSVSNPNSADVAIGLRKYLGENSSGNVLLAEILLNCYRGQYRVMYRVRERLKDGTTVENHARGVMGNWSGTIALGEDVTIGLAKDGCDVVFYCSSVPGLLKVSNCDFKNYPAGHSDAFGAWVYAGTDSDVSGTISNVNVTYSLSDAETFFGGTAINGYEKGYEKGLSQANDAPEKPKLIGTSAFSDQSGSLYWDTVLNSTWYKVYIEDSAGTVVFRQWYDSTEIDTNAGYCFLDVQQSLEPGEYKWWIKAWNDNGSQWSDEGLSFSVGN